MRLYAHGFGHQTLRLAAVLDPLAAGAGIGLPGIGQHGAGRAVAGQDLLPDLNRSGLEGIGGEESGHDGRTVGDDKADIVTAGLLETRGGGAGAEPLRQIAFHH